MRLFWLAPIGTQEGKCRLIRSDIDTHHASTRQNRARYIAILRSARDRTTTAMAGLRKLLVDDAILGLMRIHMVVTMEHCADFVFDEQLMNRHRPAWTLFGKNIFAIGILAAPLVAIRTFDPTAAVFTKTPDEVMNKDKFLLDFEDMRKIILMSRIRNYNTTPRYSFDEIISSCCKPKMFDVEVEFEDV